MRRPQYRPRRAAYSDSVKDLHRVDHDAVFFHLTTVDLHLAFLMYQIPSVRNVLMFVSQMFLNDAFNLIGEVLVRTRLSSHKGSAYLHRQSMFPLDNSVSII